MLLLFLKKQVPRAWLISFWLLGWPVLAQRPAATSGRPHAVALPPDSGTLEFVENKGQWDAQARYAAALPGGRLFLERDAFTYNFVAGLPAHHGHPTSDPTGQKPFRAQGVRVQFEGASPTAALHAESPTGSVRSYLRGADPAHWGHQAGGFRAVRYADLWAGIGARVYENAARQLEYDFELAPQADPAQLRLRYEGADRVRLATDGSLRVETSAGSFREAAPVAFQTDAAGRRQPVACAYELRGNELHFRLGPYDHNRLLTIDPTVEFSTYTGSTADNWGFTATYDPQGNLYSGGIVFDVGYPASPGAYNPTFSGTLDMALIKYNPKASGPAARVWATYLGGTAAEFPHSLVVNERGELVILGTTSSLDFPTTEGAYNRMFSGGTYLDPFRDGAPYDLVRGADLVLSRLSADGSTLLASTYLGGARNDGVLDPRSPAPRLVHNYGDYFRGDVLLDASGNVYVASSTASPDFPTPNGFATTYRGGSSDAVACQLSPDLRTLRWSNLLGGAAADAAYSLQLDKTGNLYVAGGTASPDFPTTPGALQPEIGGDVDAFVARISPGGNVLQRATYLGTRAYDQAYFLQLDVAGEVYLLGQTLGSVAISEGHYGVAGSGQYIQKLSADLNALRFSTVFGSGQGRIDLSPTAFLVDECDRVYVSGWGGSINGTLHGFDNGTTAGLPVTPDALQTTTDANDFYLAQFSPGMRGLDYATYLGNSDPYIGDHVDGGTSRFDPKGIVYQAVCSCGQSGSGFPIPPGANTYEAKKGYFNCNNAAFKMRFENVYLSASTDSVVCADRPPVPLAGRPVGGVWAGPGISGSAQSGYVFSPVNLSGIQTLTYTSPGVGACAGVAALRLRVVAPPTVRITPPAQTSFCPTSAPLTLVGSPAGGTFSGPGVREGNLFDPYLAGLGPHQIAYTYALPAGPYLSCPATATLTLTVLPPTTVQLPPDTTLCPGSTQAFRLRATPVGGTWTGPGVSGSVAAGYVFTPPADLAGRQAALLTYTPAPSSCAAPTTYRVGGAANPLLLAFHEPVRCPENSVAPLRLRFSISSSLNDSRAGTLRWEFGDGTSADVGTLNEMVEHTYAGPGTYQPRATLTYLGGRCQAQALPPPITVRAQFFPNIITPNGDRLNDTFAPVVPCAMHLRIFSRWGQQVYESAAYANDWSGEGLPGGMYYYLLDDQSGQKIKGWIEVVR